jgi:hypothetical protein
MLHHFGGFGGAHSHISFMPDRGVGVAVFVNEAGVGGSLAGVVASLAYDWLDGDTTAVAKAEAWAAEMPTRMSEQHRRIAADRENRASRKWQLSQPMESYAGTYTSERMGTLRVSIENGAPVFSIGNLRTVATPFSEAETMRVEMVPGSGTVARFGSNRSGEMTTVELMGETLRRAR